MAQQEEFSEAIRVMARESPSSIEFVRGRQPAMYFRQPLSETIREEAASAMDLDPADFGYLGTFCSDAESVTNFHYDKVAMFLHQASGRKQVLIVHPSFHDYMRSETNDVARRSWILSEKKVLTVPHWSVTLLPGDCLFIPEGYWHQVKSLDAFTLGSVLRFR